MGEKNGAVPYPYEIKELDSEVKKELAKYYASEPDFVRICPKGYILLRRFCEDAENIYNIPLRSSDVFVGTYQRNHTDAGVSLASVKQFGLRNSCKNTTHTEIPFHRDIPAVILRVADFLGKKLTGDQLARLCDHLSFENFKKNDSVNIEYLREYGVLNPEEKFIRKGKAGAWREYFDEEMTRDAEEWIAENLRDTDLRFPSFK